MTALTNLEPGVRIFFYLEDRERTLDSPTDKILLSLATYADELECERARQRTADAMLRKARARHVTGGRVFGYDNVDVATPDERNCPRRLHVDRRINEREAEIVRRIFELCVSGLGKARIARLLNSEGAVFPRPQRGHPGGWSPSFVREALYRELYHGQIVWNRTRKRNQWGQKHQRPRPESEWVRVDAPEWRIVPEELWAAAHARLADARTVYLRGTHGQLWGRPPVGVEAKYLLTGLAQCWKCGGTLEDWRGLLRRHTPQARQILRKLLKGRLVFQPEEREGCEGYRFTGEGALDRLLSGFLFDAQGVASPEGFDPFSMRGSMALAQAAGDVPRNHRLVASHSTAAADPQPG